MLTEKTTSFLTKNDLPWPSPSLTRHSASQWINEAVFLRDNRPSPIHEIMPGPWSIYNLNLPDYEAINHSVEKAEQLAKIDQFIEETLERVPTRWNRLPLCSDLHRHRRGLVPMFIREYIRDPFSEQDIPARGRSYPSTVVGLALLNDYYSIQGDELTRSLSDVDRVFKMTRSFCFIDRSMLRSFSPQEYLSLQQRAISSGDTVLLSKGTPGGFMSPLSHNEVYHLSPIYRDGYLIGLSLQEGFCYDYSRMC